MSLAMLLTAVAFLGFMFLIQAAYILRTGNRTPFFMAIDDRTGSLVARGLVRRLWNAVPCLIIGFGALWLPTISAFRKHGEAILWQRVSENLGFIIWLILFILAGIWSLTDPRAVLRWVKIPVPNDPRANLQTLALVRTIGGVFVLFGLHGLAQISLR